MSISTLNLNSIKYAHKSNRRQFLLLAILVILGYSLIFINFKFNVKLFEPLPTDPVRLPKPFKKFDILVANSKWEIGKTVADLVDCQRVFGGDENYVRRNKYFMAMHPDRLDFPMDCEAIKERNGWAAKNDWRELAGEEEANFPLAFARNVFQDYLMLEAELATNYAPQNWYCYSLDSKSAPEFRSRMHKLAECFPNVVIGAKEFPISSQGHNTSDAMVECARELAKPERRWNYLVTLQNHDFQAKTNAEMVKIFKWLDGANDVEIGKMQESINTRILFYQLTFNWSFAALELLKKENGTNMAAQLHLSKGYSSASLSREFIDFILNDLNLDKMLAQLNAAEFGVDEHIWQTLITTDALNAPGAIPQICLDQGVPLPFITRYALWGEFDSPNNLECRSNQWRHGVCVFGLQDVQNSALFQTPYLFVNKMMPEYDFGAIKCWHQRMVERRLNHSESELDGKFYQNWPQTRYNQWRKANAGNEATAIAFNCT